MIRTHENYSNYFDRLNYARLKLERIKNEKKNLLTNYKHFFMLIHSTSRKRKI